MTTSFVPLAHFTLTIVLCGRHCYFHCTDDGTTSDRLNNVSGVRAGKSQDGRMIPKPAFRTLSRLLRAALPVALTRDSLCLRGMPQRSTECFRLMPHRDACLSCLAISNCRAGTISSASQDPLISQQRPQCLLRWMDGYKPPSTLTYAIFLPKT